MLDATTPVLGWGYEGRCPEDLVQFLAVHDVTTLVDVRLTPLSRRKGFSKSALRSTVTGAGADYVHLRELGNPRDNRPAFAMPGTPAAETAHRRYEEEVLGGSQGSQALAIVRDLVRRGPLVLLCFEADQTMCHRALVTRALVGGVALMAPA